MVDAKILENPEYEFLKTNPYLGNNIILLGLGGSHAYGTNIETSDVDIRGVATRTSEEILLSRDFEEVVDTGTDTTVYSFDRILELLAACNPNSIEILGLRPQDYLKLTDAGKMLIDNKKAFISKLCIKTFGGYAIQQLYRLQQKTLAALTPEEYNGHIVKVINGMSDHLLNSWNITGVRVKESGGKLLVDIEEMKDVPLEAFYGITNEIGNVIKEYNKNSTRNNKAIEHGKINKHAMHLLRLYMMCCDLLEKGEIITFRADEHDLLMDIRNGRFTGADGMIGTEFFDILKQYEERFENAKKITKLPDNPDLETIDRLHRIINKNVITQVWTSV